MAFAPGQFITAQRLNRLQPKTYWAQASGTTAVSQTNVDITGATVAVTVETDGATLRVDWNMTAQATAITGGQVSARAWIGSDASPVYTVAQFSAATEKAGTYETWMTTVPTAGLYTCKLVGTTPAQATIVSYSTITVTVTEVV
jgi:hypothetical protein